MTNAEKTKRELKRQYPFLFAWGELHYQMEHRVTARAYVARQQDAPYDVVKSDGAGWMRACELTDDRLRKQVYAKAAGFVGPAGSDILAEAELETDELDLIVCALVSARQRWIEEKAATVNLSHLDDLTDMIERSRKLSAKIEPVLNEALVREMRKANTGPVSGRDK